MWCKWNWMNARGHVWFLHHSFLPLSWYHIIDKQTLSILYIAVIIFCYWIHQEKQYPNIYKCQRQIHTKIQPTTLCRIQLTLDKNQAKTQCRSCLSTNRPFLNSSSLKTLYRRLLVWEGQLGISCQSWAVIFACIPNLKTWYRCNNYCSKKIKCKR